MQAFTGWLNAILESGSSHLFIKDLTEDLSTGLPLLEMVEILDERKIPHTHAEPKTKFHNLVNVQAFLDYYANKHPSQDLTGITANCMRALNTKISCPQYNPHLCSMKRVAFVQKYWYVALRVHSF